MSTERTYAALPPHFRQHLADPLERTQRTAVLDQIAENWLRWSKGDSRWDTVAAMLSVFDRAESDAGAAGWAGSLAVVVEAVRDASQARSPLVLEDALMAIDDLASAVRAATEDL